MVPPSWLAFPLTIQEVNTLFYVWVGTDSPYQMYEHFIDSWDSIKVKGNKYCLKETEAATHYFWLQSDSIKRATCFTIFLSPFLMDKYSNATQMVKRLICLWDDCVVIQFGRILVALCHFMFCKNGEHCWFCLPLMCNHYTLFSSYHMW